MSSKSRPCPECNVEIGEFHLDDCGVDRCSKTGIQRLSCHMGPDHTGCGGIAWTGSWPGVEECHEYGFWAVFTPNEGWKTVPEGTPHAVENLNRLVQECVWDEFGRRWHKVA